VSTEKRKNFNNLIVNQQLKTAWNSPSIDQGLYSYFSNDEIIVAFKTLKSGKAPRPDNLHPEFFLHLDEKCYRWLRLLFKHCLHTKNLPKIWKLAKNRSCTQAKQTI